MKFKLGLAMTLCIALGTANVVAFAGENTSVFNAPATAITVSVAATETPATETPATETPAVETPAVEAPAVEAPAVETPAVETPAVETPAVETPAVETPAVETPAVETPAVETPAVETPAVETPAVETPAVETPAEEIIEIPEVEIPLAEELPLVEVPQEEATLIITHKLQFDVGEGVQEQIVTGLKAGETVNLADYIATDDEIKLSAEVGSVVLVAGENTAEIQYEFINKAANINENVQEEGDC